MSTDVHTLSGAYALDALTPEEAEEFARHLDACESCRTEVREFRQAAARMGAAEALTPPAELRGRLLAIVDRTPQLPPPPASASDPERPSSGAARLPAGAPDQGKHGSRRWLTWVATAAAAVVLIGIGVVGIRSAFSPATPQLSAAASEVFTSSDVRTTTVKTANGGQLRVGVSTRLHEMAVDTRDLPALDGSHVYQIWTVRGDTMHNAAVLTDPEAGAAMGLPGPATRVAVTVEPKGGSKQPTTAPIVQVDPGAL
jgi:anti-sigma factor RsiW